MKKSRAFSNSSGLASSSSAFPEQPAHQHPNQHSSLNNIPNGQASSRAGAKPHPLGLNRLRLISYPEGQKKPPGNPSGFEKNRETQVTMPTWHIGHLGWASGFVHTQVGIARKKLLQRDPSFHQSELAT